MTAHAHIFTVKRDGHTVTVCDNPIRHSPIPKRIIGHHVLPQVCGGRTTRDNIAALCDSCHYSTHIGLWTLQFAPARYAHLRLSAQLDQLARRGFADAQAAGTAELIPKEGVVDDTAHRAGS